MPSPKRPPEDRQGHKTRDVGTVPADDPAADGSIEAIEVPKPPPGWLKTTRESWDRYFRSAARHVTVLSLDLDLLERLWSLYDERARAHAELKRPIKNAEGKIVRRDSRMIEGSKGQMRPNGLYNVIARLDAEIRQLEDRLPKSAKARLILGMVVGGDDRPDDADEPGDAPAEHVTDDDGPDTRLYVLDGRAG